MLSVTASAVFAVLETVPSPSSPLLLALPTALPTSVDATDTVVLAVGELLAEVGTGRGGEVAGNHVGSSLGRPGVVVVVVTTPDDWAVVVDETAVDALESAAGWGGKSTFVQNSASPEAVAEPEVEHEYTLGGGPGS
jgi:hypothetical protein